jgi:phosphate starvation-inducible PhoH-like protein
MQIKMFLTRLGPSEKCIITGDLTQIDLPFHTKSGLKKAIEILDHLEGIGTVYLNADDVVRHRLVREIIIAYEKLDEENRLRRLANDERKLAPPPQEIEANIINDEEKSAQ